MRDVAGDQTRQPAVIGDGADARPDARVDDRARYAVDRQNLVWPHPTVLAEQFLDQPDSEKAGASRDDHAHGMTTSWTDARHAA